jgi:molybdenum cofactor biosynthesis protein B
MTIEHPGSLPRLSFSFLTVSDSRQADTDTGGQLLRELATAAGHDIVDSRIVRDETVEIADAARAMLVDPTDVLVVTGGTGFSPRDVTVDALTPILERPIDGFGELFRQLSYAQVGAAAMLSRACAGLVGRRAVFLLPGSPKGVGLAMESLILPAAGHLLALVRQR